MWKWSLATARHGETLQLGLIADRHRPGEHRHRCHRIGLSPQPESPIPISTNSAYTSHSQRAAPSTYTLGATIRTAGWKQLPLKILDPIGQLHTPAHWQLRQPACAASASTLRNRRFQSCADMLYSGALRATYTLGGDDAGCDCNRCGGNGRYARSPILDPITLQPAVKQETCVSRSFADRSPT